MTKLLVRNVASASSAKWVLSALATLALSPVFLWRGVGWARRFGVGLFLLYLASGVLTLWGVLGGRPLLVVVTFKSNFLSALVIAFVFTRRPEWVVQRP